MELREAKEQVDNGLVAILNADYGRLIVGRINSIYWACALGISSDRPVINGCVQWENIVEYMRVGLHDKDKWELCTTSFPSELIPYKIEAS